MAQDSDLEATRKAFMQPPKPWEWSLEGLSAAGLVATWAVLLGAWGRLPDRVPTHFGFDGLPTTYGSPGSLLVLAAVQLGFWLGLTLLLRVPPRRLNQPVPITAANAQRMVTSTRFTNRALKAFITLMLGLVVVQTVLVSLDITDRLPGWFVPVVLVLPLVIIGGSLTYSLRGARAAEREDTGKAGSRAQQDGGSPVRSLAWTLGFLAAVAAATLLVMVAISRWHIAASRAAAVATGLLMIAAGLVMPFLPPNLQIGIRVRWTLGSAHVWRLTHQRSAFLWVPGGALLMVLGLLDWYAPYAHVVVPVAAAAGSVLTAYRVGRVTPPDP